MNILKLKPIYDKTIWANDVLTKMRHDDFEMGGTSWEVSAHPYNTNEIVNGEYAGKTLQYMVDNFHEEMIGNKTNDDLLRCAFLDAKNDLSIQVHPYQSYAKENDNDNGKTESWYVLEASEDATLVAGTNNNDPKVIRKAIEDENLEQYLEYHHVKAGDFIHIPAGLLHALGGGILAIEFGTNSNTTYRFYDYGRKDADGNGRELHLEKGFDVVNLDIHSEVTHHKMEGRKNNIEKLVECDNYTVELVDVVDEMTINNEQGFNALVCVYGEAEISDPETINVKCTDSLFVPASIKEYKIKGNCRIIRGYCK